MAKKKNPAWKHELEPNSKEYINLVAISGDGKKAVAGSYFYNSNTQNSAVKKVGMFAYDSSGSLLWPAIQFNVTVPPSSAAGVYAVAISKDGKCAACGGLQAAGQGFAYVYKVDSNSGDQYQLITPSQRVNAIALSGKTAGNQYVFAAGADALYISIGSGTNWSTKTIATNSTVEEVAVSVDGKWIVAAIYGGSIILVQNTNSTTGGLTTYGPYKPMATTPSSVIGLAIAADGSGFAAGVTVVNTSGTVYYFKTSAFAVNPLPANPASWSAPLAGCVSCRSVAVSKNGKYVSAVGTVGTVPATATGTLFLFQNNGNNYTQQFASSPGLIAQSPNCTSMDDTGLFIAVADGYTTHDANAAFYLFSAATPGDPTTIGLDWSHVTKSENHAMQISADGTAIAGGSDDGNLYYFSVS
jgi:WD40 repeat protein